MTTITINLWLLFVGAAAGLAAAYAAKGRNRLIKAAVIGAVVAFVIGLARTYL
ncbi:hypothetical protein [Parasulfitobacter algicola]|uniref:Transmembrane protein n=1 Tax=Parasulfitobacter algicola TaxID=2614809 RepID=A0ABX2IQ76_9RHOB|nr:hypothetical protein [Sulfitobacter algicola]NSX54515.1 hypothetical protein [Sulfitobacter algicola]